MDKDRRPIRFEIGGNLALTLIMVALIAGTVVAAIFSK
jgi:hypothetical protein